MIQQGLPCMPCSCVDCSDPVTRNETQPCDSGYWYDPAAGYESTIVTDVSISVLSISFLAFSDML